MKRLSRIIFVVSILLLIATGLIASVAQAEPFWCHVYCPYYGNGCELTVSCTCPDPTVGTTCYGFCRGVCEV